MSFQQRVLLALVGGYFVITTLNGNLTKWMEIYHLKPSPDIPAPPPLRD